MLGCLDQGAGHGSVRVCIPGQGFGAHPAHSHQKRPTDGHQPLPLRPED